MTQLPESENTFAHRVRERFESGGHLLILPARLDSVISFTGSFRCGLSEDPGKVLARDMAVALFDKGTAVHTRDEIAEILEKRASRLQFFGDGIRVRVSGRVLREDFGTVMHLLGEMLFTPVFPVEEFERVRDRSLAAYRRSLTDTGHISSSSLSRLVYDTGHPNFIRDPETEIELMENLTIEDVRSSYTEIHKTTDWTLALVGDIDPDFACEQFNSVFKDQSLSMELPPFGSGEISGTPSVQKDYIPGRDNLDVRFGHPVPMTRLEDAFLPLSVGVFVLGGNFSARLMSRIRDDMGLTYGIGSSLSGFDPLYHGAWITSVTLSRENLEPGIDAVRAELDRFVSEGVTATELEEKKQTLRGAHKVSLSTTANLADALLRNAEREREVNYLDQYPEMISNIGLREVNSSIRDYLNPGALQCAVAGTLPDSEKP
jgi:zinc protease